MQANLRHALGEGPQILRWTGSRNSGVEITTGLALLSTALSAQSPPVLKRWSSINQAGVEALQSGNPRRAERRFRAAVSLAERFQTNREDLAVSLTNLGEVLFQQRKFGESARVFDRACLLWKRVEGERQNFALALAGKAGATEGLGHPEEAEVISQRAIRITEVILGADHDAVASMLNNLAVLYVRAHRYTEAEELLNRALRISDNRGDALGRATTLNNLGSDYYAQKRYAARSSSFLRLVASGNLNSGRTIRMWPWC